MYVCLSGLVLPQKHTAHSTESSTRARNWPRHAGLLLRLYKCVRREGEQRDVYKYIYHRRLHGFAPELIVHSMALVRQVGTI